MLYTAHWIASSTAGDLPARPWTQSSVRAAQQVVPGPQGLPIPGHVWQASHTRLMRRRADGLHTPSLDP